MSKDLNMVQLTGRLGKDPETRYTPQGSAITKVTVASNRRWRTADGQDREETEWFNVVAWDKLAELCAQYLRKGSRVYFQGRLQTHSWEDQATGQKRYMTEVIANDMIMLDTRRDSMSNDGGGYDEPDIGYQEPEVEGDTMGGRGYSQRAEGGRGSSAPQQAPRATGNGNAPARPAPQRAPQPSTQPRRAAPAPAVDEDDLPF